jgi:hypothetical protein
VTVVTVAAVTAVVRDSSTLASGPGSRLPVIASGTLVFGIVSSIADTFSLSESSALKPAGATGHWQFVQLERPWVSAQVRMFCKSVRDIFTPAAGPFYIPKGSVASAA